MTPKRPDLRVIDLAIERIRQDRNGFSCIALDAASEEVHGRGLSIYARQFRLHVLSRNHDEFPSWWNERRSIKKPRIAALKAFRKACIDAAKKERRK